MSFSAKLDYSPYIISVDRDLFIIQDKAFTISTLLSSIMSQMSLNDGRDSGLKVLSIITVSNQTIHEKTIAGLCRMRLYKFSNSTHQVSKQGQFLELAFTPCKVEQPLWGMELQEK